MRRLLVWTLATGIVLVAGESAMAKEGHEDPREGATWVISPVPGDLQPGRAWTATITLLKDGRVVDAAGFPPVMTLRNLGTGEVTGVSTLSQPSGVYTARIVFPEAGRWSIRVHDSYSGRLTDITTFRLSEASATAPSSPWFPGWVWVTAAGTSFLLAAGTLLLLRLHREQAALMGQRSQAKVPSFGKVRSRRYSPTRHERCASLVRVACHSVVSLTRAFSWGSTERALWSAPGRTAITPGTTR